MREIAIAVDGPGSSGKGTVARRVAEVLGYQLVDTGTMYRTVGLFVLRAGEDVANQDACTRIADSIQFRFAFTGGALTIEANGEDVSAEIRGESVGAAASAVAVHPGVRSALLGLQRSLAGHGGVVMDGRDIGTVVLPNAELKIYLDASLSERARRRWKEHPERSFEEVEAELAARDYQDTHRAVAPLCAAEDAIRIDSTGLTIEAVVKHIVALARALRA